MKRFLLHLPVLTSVSLLIVACTSTSSSKFDPRESASLATAGEAAFASAGLGSSVPAGLLQKPSQPYTLGPGDKLEVEILGEEGSRAETYVTPDSRIYFDLLPGVDVGGKNVSEVQEELEQQLTTYYRQPQVAVTLREAVSQRVLVLGRLNEPGVYPMTEPLRVLDAISKAGGLFTSRFTGTTEELADLKHSFLIRDGRMLPVDFERLLRHGDMSQNIYLQSEDLIYLPSALTNEVYVLGAVLEPRPIGFMNEMNLMAALSKGLGLRPDADLSRVSIIRGSLTDPQIAVVNANDVLQGKATNVRLEPGDIVYVPGAGANSIGGYAREAVNTFVNVVAANEGSRAGASGGGNVGINVPIGGAR